MNKNLSNKISLYEETLDTKEIFNGKVIKVHIDHVRLINNNISTREVVEHRGGVCVIAFTKEKNIFLVNQFRYPYKEEILEVPAGKLEQNESPIECAKRELTEETGIIGKNYMSLGIIYPSPGYSAEKIYTYCCEVDYHSTMNLDDDEFIYVEKISLKEAVERVMSNKINDSKTQICILKLSKILKII